jgi:hypothetical protein
LAERELDQPSRRGQIAIGPSARRAVVSELGAIQASSQRDPAMSDKSPRQSMTKKTGKSIKEKRADKRNKASEETLSDKIHPGKRK